MEDYSVLMARDPSINGWHQRPKPGNMLVKQLLSVFEAEASENVPFKVPFKVFLRIKPSQARDGTSAATSFTILDDHTLSTFAPHDSVAYKNQGSSVTHQYKFTKIFGANYSQKQVFDESVADSIKDFVIGNNALIFAYGTTNAGKTFTVQGTEQQPGLVPRALDLLFKQVGNKVAREGRYKPEKVDDIVELDDVSMAKDTAYKHLILQWDWENHTVASRLDSSDLNCSDFKSNVFREMQKTILDEMPLGDEFKEGDAVFSIWVSFAEVYNENIYDLLAPVQGGGARRIPLKLGQDSHGNTYIKDLRHIHVASGDEAFQVMLYGKTHLQIAATNINSQSSRSHSVFSVKLVRYVNSEASPSYARVSNISFCDLAGAERVKKTLNVGDRLKESTNINTSLHVLGRCLSTIKDNQNCKYKKQVPFRESKLTRLFQRAMQGQESVTMVVNVNCSSILYDETVHVLKFSAIAKQIVLQTPIKRARRGEKKKSRFSSMALRPSKSICWENPSDEELESRQSDRSGKVNDELVAQNEALLDKVRKLQDELRNEKRKNLSIERDLRISLTEQFSKLLQKTEQKWKERLREAEAQAEENSSWRITKMEEYYEGLLNKKRKRMSEDGLDESQQEDDEPEENKETIKELEEALASEKENLETLKATLREIRQERDSLRVQNSQLKFSLAHSEQLVKNNEKILQATNESSTDKLVEELQKQLLTEREESAVKTKQIESMKALLDEAREDVVLLNKEKEEAENEADNFEQQFAEKAEIVKDLSAKVEDLENVVRELTDTSERKDTDIAKYEDTIKALENKLSEAKTEATKIAELENQLKTLSVAEGSEEKVEAAIKEKESIRKELEEALSKLAEQESLLEEKKIAEAELLKANEKLKIYEEKINVLENVKDESELLAKLKAQVTLLTAKSKLSDEKSEDLRRSVEARDELIAALEEQKEKMKEMIENLGKRIAASNELIQKNELLVAEKLKFTEIVAQLSSRLEIEEKKQSETASLKEEKARLKEKIQVLEKELENVERMKEDKMAKSDEKVSELQKQLDDLLIWKKQQKESFAKQIRECEDKYEKDMKAMQTDLKKALQKNVELEENIRSAHNESSRLQQEVKNALQQSQIEKDERSSAVELVKMVKDQKKEIDQLRSDLQAQLEEQKYLKDALGKKEEELKQFEVNRDVLLNRYETMLKQATEETKREKSENTKLAQTLYQKPNQPTPNKADYEAEIRRLKDMIFHLNSELAGCKSTSEQSAQLEVPVDAGPKRRAVKKSTASNKDKLSVKGSYEDLNQISEPEPPRSARRTQRKKTVDSAMLAPPTPAEEECAPLKRSTRKKLYAAPSTDKVDAENLDPIDMKQEPMTPELFVKTLRSRRI